MSNGITNITMENLRNMQNTNELANSFPTYMFLNRQFNKSLQGPMSTKFF